MGRTIIDRAVENNFERLSAEDPTWFSAASKIRKNIATGFYGSDGNVVAQYFMDPPYHEAWAFGNVWAWLMLGTVYLCQLPMGETPPPDAAIDLMNERLTRGMAIANDAVIEVDGHDPGLAADFWGGTQDGDGSVTWSGALDFVSASNETGTNKHLILPSGSAALEVGYQPASKTMFTLVSSCYLARWPYRSDLMTILYLPPGDVRRRDFPFQGIETGCRPVLQPCGARRGDGCSCLDWLPATGQPGQPKPGKSTRDIDAQRSSRSPLPSRGTMPLRHPAHSV